MEISLNEYEVQSLLNAIKLYCMLYKNDLHNVLVAETFANLKVIENKLEMES